ncbi:hypothetical protein PUN28_002713 [Cardiocondyla obscurior]|uniref:Uncharacterized protein n=1 Tax=Cardiocondyla obscurior TaxID=286306 RepID=A0AAW2GW13_9HYME
MLIVLALGRRTSIESRRLIKVPTGRRASGVHVGRCKSTSAINDFWVKINHEHVDTILNVKIFCEESRYGPTSEEKEEKRSSGSTERPQINCVNNK